MPASPPPAITRQAPVMLVVMGVSGCGKSVIGQRVARHLDWPFLDGDALHSASNIAKMHAGHSLDDADREPWLEAIGHWMDVRQAAGQSAVIACSALKRRYRDQLRRHRAGVCFAWLQVEREELERRVRRRSDHFMPASLLDSQLATLEPPAADEPAWAIAAHGDIETTAQAVLQRIRKAIL